MRPIVSMREALSDPALLGGALPGDSWGPWRVLLIAGMGEPLDDAELEIFSALTGRASAPTEPVRETWAIVGRRAGKTRAAATFGAYVGALCDHSGYLAPGERGVLPILAASTDQAGRAFMHIKGILEHSPVLAAQIDGEVTANTIRLRTGVDVVVRPANFRTVRSITAPAAICDEIAFWMIENSANPDEEVLRALRPAFMTTRGPMWVISSPYAKKGALYKTYKKHFGPTGGTRVLVAKGPSKIFNSTLPQEEVDAAYAEDPTAALTEFGAEFRNDIEGYVSIEIVEACVEPGVRERPYERGKVYKAFVDPSGGVSDSMTLAIAHREGDRAVLDVARERKAPFQPADVVEDFAKLLQAYGISEVTGDRYGGEWPRDEFRKQGVAYRLSDLTRSDLYRELLPMLNSKTADLLDLPVLVNQLVGLERRVSRGGRESIDHAPNGHDDLANSVAGVMQRFAQRYERPTAVFATYGSGR